MYTIHNRRRSGLVLPVSALPGPHGIGSLGDGAYAFVDFLRKAGQSYWQILPLSPTGFGDSPYQSCSAWAGNPYFIDLDRLEREGLLRREDYAGREWSPDRVDYSGIYLHRMGVFRRAFLRGRGAIAAELAAFREKHADWLPDYALYMAAKMHFGMAALRRWPDKELLRRDPKALARWRGKLADEIELHEFIQMLFFRQWRELKEYAAENGIAIIGDVPIYVAEDSVEVWVSGELFLLSEPGVPAQVAGVPPDLYAATGQLWGNPLYDWSRHKRDGYRWWIERLRHSALFYDVIRIDHFRAFYDYWVVEAGEETALNGHWEPGPGMDFINAVRAALPDAGFIAEDLGDLSEEVFAFIRQTGMPGMSVALYGFDPQGDSAYLSHNVKEGTVAYTSTHDSPTFVGWLETDASDEERRFAAEYLRLRDDEGLGWGVVKAVWATAAHLAMAPLQDVLGLGADARVNTPSTLGGDNWCWRVRIEAFNDEVARRLHKITETYRRLPPDPVEEVEAEDEFPEPDGDEIFVV